MHNLDDLTIYPAIDPGDARARIAALAEQCAAAYAAGQAFDVGPQRPIANIVIAGMGGSAIGGSLVQALVAGECGVPISVWRDYGLPAHANGPGTLVIAASNSGNTEEVLSAFDQAAVRGCAIIATCTGGALAERATAHGSPTFRFSWGHQPREAVGWSAFPLIAIFEKLGLIADKSADVAEAVALMTSANERLRPESPTHRNSAKRTAGQFMDRLPIIYGAGVFGPVARRWKTQLNENAKMMAAWDEMPELNHNTVVGLELAQPVWQKSIVVQLRGALDHPRNVCRFDMTTELLLEAGANQDTIRAQGESALAQQFSLVQYGDWASYYAGIISGIDPTPIGPLDKLKRALSER